MLVVRSSDVLAGATLIHNLAACSFKAQSRFVVRSSIARRVAKPGDAEGRA